MRRLLSDEKAASAAEFALVLPLLLILLFAIIDGGRLMWTINRAEKAAHMGARHAAVTAMIPSSLASYKFATGTEVTKQPPGTTVPLAVWESTTCDASECLNSGGLGPAPGYSEDAYTAIKGRMVALMSEIDDPAVSVTVTYSNVEVGYSGDPHGPDVAPAIKVAIDGLTFRPITTLSLATFNLPQFSASMTMEDGQGTISSEGTS
jgi:Flp pilus assembly protein TadG